MTVIPAAELFGGLPLTREAILDDAASGAIIQARAELVSGLSIEPAIARGVHIVKEMYGLDDMETSQVVRNTFAELFGKSTEEIEHEVELFWEHSKQAFLSDVSEGEEK